MLHISRLETKFADLVLAVLMLFVLSSNLLAVELSKKGKKRSPRSRQPFESIWRRKVEQDLPLFSSLLLSIERIGRLRQWMNAIDCGRESTL